MRLAVFSTYSWKIAQSEDTQETRLSASAVADNNQLSVGWMKSVSLDVSSPPRCSVIHFRFYSYQEVLVDRKVRGRLFLASEPGVN